MLLRSSLFIVEESGHSKAQRNTLEGSSKPCRAIFIYITT